MEHFSLGKLIKFDCFYLGKLTEMEHFSLGKLTEMEKNAEHFPDVRKMICVSILLIVNSFRGTADGRVANKGRLFGAVRHECLAPECGRLR